MENYYLQIFGFSGKVQWTRWVRNWDSPLIVTPSLYQFCEIIKSFPDRKFKKELLAISNFILSSCGTSAVNFIVKNINYNAKTDHENMKHEQLNIKIKYFSKNQREINN